MNVTLSLDEKLVKEIRKIAVENDTTLTGLIRDYLEKLAAESARSGKQRRALEALERSFRLYSSPLGKRNWTRAELHERR